MQLSNEDNLRLNVLLAQSLQAIRINEGTMTVYALTEKGEAKVQLNPTVRDEQYLRWVRELVSLKVTGSPGGYPIFIKRWTRMGHANNTLQHMLLLGEPEAIVAMVHAPTLNHEEGRRAWWANPTTEVARRLLHYPDVVSGELGKEVSQYLLEFLPFEEVQRNVVETVQLCLQANLITEKQRKSLWNRAKRKNPYYVGFAHSKQNIPLEKQIHPALPAIEASLKECLAAENTYALQLCELLSADGQRWLQTLKYSFQKPVDQDVVTFLFTSIHKNCALHFPEGRGVREIQFACDRSNQLCAGEGESDCPDALNEVITALDNQYLPLLNATLLLAQLGEDTLIPIFSGNDSVGTVMRRRLEPLTTPILERVDLLMA